MRPYKIFTLNLAQKAGRIMLKHFSTNVKNSYKPDHSPVTKADLDINKLVIQSVKKQFRAHDVLGEEQRYDQDIRSHIVSNGHLHSQLGKRVRTYVLKR